MKHIEIALTQVGVQEIPKNSNKGPDVEKYLASVGLNGGYAWCAAFVYWCFKQAYGIDSKLIKTAGVLDLWNRTPAKYKFKIPKAGDIGIMDFGGGKGHEFLVKSVDRLNVHTIEGNSNDEGSREGYEVCERTRLISSCKGFIRII